jgi:uncharacterized membrane protein (DUF373 family)
METEGTSEKRKRATRLVHLFEQAISIALLMMMGAVVLLSTLDLAVVLIRDIVTPPVLLLSGTQLLELFSLFLNVLIGLELIETVRVHVAEGAVRAEMVIMVAMIAVLRKIILLDPKEAPGIVVLGVAAIVLGLGISHYLVTRAR